MTEQRKGYENFVYQNGVLRSRHQGDMRRNERNLMWNLRSLHFKRTGSSPQPWGWTPGARYSSVWFDSNDRYVVGKMVMIAAEARAITSETSGGSAEVCR